jgi:hypothetical protein
MQVSIESPGCQWGLPGFITGEQAIDHVPVAFSL